METGNKIKLGLILGLILLVLYLSFSDSINISLNQNVTLTNESANYNLPQCIDGIDNDGDGYTDYLEDNDCSDSKDNSERNYDFIIWLIGGFLGGGFCLFLIYYKYFKPKSNNDSPFQEPIQNERASVLAISWFIKKYLADDIFFEPINNKEPNIYKPRNPKDIIVLEHFKSIENQEYFQYLFFQVNIGSMNGVHHMKYSLSRGEEHILGGVDRLQLHTPRVFWESLKRTFKDSSPETKQERMLQFAYENGEDLSEVSNLLKSNPSNNTNVSNNPLGELDDTEFKNYMSEQARLNSNKRSNKSKKNTNTSPIIYPDVEVDSNE